MVVTMAVSVDRQRCELNFNSLDIKWKPWQLHNRKRGPFAFKFHEDGSSEWITHKVELTRTIRQIRKINCMLYVYANDCILSSFFPE